MLYSTDRIMTTHAGSLPRPEALRAMVVARARGEAVDQAAFEAALARGDRRGGATQVACGARQRQ